ncbi:MAG TPA: hypothetical protein VIK18_08690 [Pirellulales bacterium]
MDSILRPLQLTWVIRSNVLLITTTSEAETLIEWVIYPVEDLLFPPPELRVPGRQYLQPDYDSLIELIGSMIAPTTWAEGGPPPIHPFHGALVLSQTQQVHEQIAELLAGLRAARNAQFAPATDQPATPIKTAVLRPSDTAYAALRQPVQLDLREANLGELVKQVARQIKIPVMIDAWALEDAGIHADKIRFTRRLQNLSLHNALDRLLEGQKLGWAVQDGVLLITSREQSEVIFETRVYLIRTLGSRTAMTPLRRFTEEFDSVLPLIPDAVAANRGEAPGAARVFASAGALVVWQASQAHVEIEEQLAALRKFRAEHPGDAVDKVNQPPAEDELVIIPYALPAYFGRVTETVPMTTSTQTRSVAPSQADRERIAQQLAAALPKLVAPESWGSGRGSIEIVGDVLYIRQRLPVHEQVSKFLAPHWWIMAAMGGISGAR